MLAARAPTSGSLRGCHPPAQRFIGMSDRSPAIEDGGLASGYPGQVLRICDAGAPSGYPDARRPGGGGDQAWGRWSLAASPCRGVCRRCGTERGAQVAAEPDPVSGQRRCTDDRRGARNGVAECRWAVCR